MGSPDQGDHIPMRKIFVSGFALFAVVGAVAIVSPANAQQAGGIPLSQNGYGDKHYGNCQYNCGGNYGGNKYGNGYGNKGYGSSGYGNKRYGSISIHGDTTKD
jgi:hypothetical protein